MKSSHRIPVNAGIRHCQNLTGSLCCTAGQNAAKHACESKTLTGAETWRLENLEKRYRNAAREQFEKRVAYYHKITGGTYTSITVRDQKTRWGSCSSRGTLSFNYRLIFAPPVVLDYVVAHELCHLTHMNHSKDFWNMVASVMPDYKVHRQWLRDHGNELTIENHMRKLGIPVSLS